MASRGRIYEQERLLLYVQERLAEAIEQAGINRSELARRLDVNRSYVTQVLSKGRGLTVKTVASLLHATGHRLALKLERIDGDPGDGRR